MNNLKIQQDILKAILANPENVKHYDFENRIGEECTFVTITGAVGYVIRTCDLRVRLSDAQYIGDLHLESFIQPDNLLSGTDAYRLKGTARRYEKLQVGADPVYVDTSLLKNFENPVLFQPFNSSSGMIVVAEEPWDDGSLYVRGAVAPIRVDDEKIENTKPTAENEDDWTE